MAHHVKTAISLDQSLFDELVRLARSMQVSRSELLAKALAEYLERRHNRELLAELNEVYAEEPDEEERAVLGYARRQHRRIAGAES